MARPMAHLKCCLTDYTNKPVFSAIEKISPSVGLSGIFFFTRIGGRVVFFKDYCMGTKKPPCGRFFVDRLGLEPRLF